MCSVKRNAQDRPETLLYTQMEQPTVVHSTFTSQLCSNMRSSVNAGVGQHGCQAVLVQANRLAPALHA